MPFLLRVDIDKPYGHHTFFNKILSKSREDYYFPAIEMLNYLKPTIEFLKFCNQHKVTSFLYFRNCTVPSNAVNLLIKEGGHKIGFHAEDTRTIETFKNEFFEFENKIGEKVNYFTKHGSGQLKLGRNHYPPFEPEKYKIWGKQLNIDFSLGNGIATCLEDFIPKDGFYSSMFWLESDYRHPNLNKIDDLIDFAKSNIVPLVIHPANFYTFPNVKNDLKRLIDLSKMNNITWLNEII
jgi:hypothetical protein